MICVGNGKRRVGEKAVTPSAIAGSNTKHFTFDRTFAMNHYGPVHGANELRRSPAPAHAFWNRQAGGCFFNTVGDEVDGGESG